MCFCCLLFGSTNSCYITKFVELLNEKEISWGAPVLVQIVLILKQFYETGIIAVSA